MKKGLILSFITIIFWALSSVCTRFVAIRYEVSPSIFTYLKFFTAAIVLIIIAGPGRGGISTIKRPHTWLYSIFLIGTNLFFMLTMLYMPATKASLLLLGDIVVSMPLVWFLFNRKPTKTEMSGALVILGALYMITQGLNPETKFLGVLCIMIAIVFGVVRAIIAEIHPDSNNAKTVKDECRVTGYVSMVTSFIFIIFTLILAGLKMSLSAEIIDSSVFAQILPDISNFYHKETVLSGIIIGAFIIPFSMYFFFCSAKHAKSEVFFMVAALHPFAIYAFELLFERCGLLSAKEISHKDLLCGLVIVIASTIMIIRKHRKSKMLAG